MTGFTNTAPPTITGSRVVGGTITASVGTWTPTPNTFTYQWERADDTSGTNDTPIVGATGATYTIDPADTNKFLRVGVYPEGVASSVGTVQGQSVAMLKYNTGGFDPLTAIPFAHTSFLGPDSTMATRFTSFRSVNTAGRLLIYISPFRMNDGGYAKPTGGTVSDTSANTFVNSTFARSRDVTNPTDLWVLHNSAGTQVANELHINADPKKLLDVGKQSLQDYSLTQAQAILAAYPEADGFFFDEVNGNIGALSNGANPLPSTGATFGGTAYATAPTGGVGSAWFNAVVDWFQTVGSTVTGIRSQLSPRGVPYYIVANAGSSPTTLYETGYAQFNEAIAPYVDGIDIEWFLQTGGAAGSMPGDPNPRPQFNINPADFRGHWDSWFKGPNHIQATCGKHAYVGSVLARFTTGGSLVDDQQKMLYARGSYLLCWDGIDGGNWMWFYTDAAGTTSPLDPRWTTYIGQPLTGAQLTANVNVSGTPRGYLRYFENGVVCVNPSLSTTVVFTLNKAYTSLDTNTGVSSVTLAPKRAFIGTS